MRGYEQNNHAAFDKAENELKIRKVFDVVNPAKLDRELGFDCLGDMDKNFLIDALRRDMIAITECDAIYLLRGWEKSDGARAEHALAVALNLYRLYE